MSTWLGTFAKIYLKMSVSLTSHDEISERSLFLSGGVREERGHAAARRRHGGRLHRAVGLGRVDFSTQKSEQLLAARWARLRSRKPGRFPRDKYVCNKTVHYFYVN